MRPENRSLAILLLLCLGPAAQPQETADSPARPPLLDGAALERSLATLQLEMKLKVLQTYYARGGFYIQPTWPQRLNDEYRELTAGMDKASSLKGVDVDEWLTEVRKQRENEVLAFFDLIQENIPKIVKPFLTADNA